MQIHKLPYGKGEVTFELPDDVEVDIISPIDIQGAANPLEEVTRAINEPFDCSLSDFVGANSAAIAINDKTRPVPHQFLLPPLLDALSKLGIPPHKIVFVIANGTHIPLPVKDYQDVLSPDIVAKYPIISHNCDDLSSHISLGETSRNTPVSINRSYFEADLKISIGNIEPHHFMGFSGGVKSVSIGLAGRNTINKNHAHLIDPNADIGVFEENPMRQDVEEIGDIAGVHFVINAILNSKKQIAVALSGNPHQVMRRGIKIIREKCLKEVPLPYDLVIASPGGYPKDINFYQSQKGISHSSVIVKDGGYIILAAECSEGSGSQSFEEYMHDIKSCADVFNKFQIEGFKVGPHKAFQIARIASRKQIFLISEIPSEIVRNWLITPEPNINAAINKILDTHPEIKRIAIMPRAVNTIPKLAQS